MAAALAKDSRGQDKIDVDNDALEAFLKAFDWRLSSGLEGDRLVSALQGMSTNPGAWRHSIGPATNDELNLRSALVALVAGMSAIKFVPERHHRVPANFFNAGVDLLRRTDRRRECVIRARVIVNALGLLWSLKRANNISIGLVDQEGIDCAVNLLGAFSEGVVVSHWAAGEVFPRIATAFIFLGNQMGGKVEIESHRIQGSLRTMGEESATYSDVVSRLRKPVAAEALSTMTRAAIAEMSAEVSDSLLDSTQGIWSAAFAQPLRRLLGECFGDDPIDSHLSDVEIMIRGVVVGSRDLPAYWIQKYGDWRTVHNNPLVEAGLLKDSEWLQLEAKSQQSCSSAASALDEALLSSPLVGPAEY